MAYTFESLATDYAAEDAAFDEYHEDLFAYTSPDPINGYDITKYSPEDLVLDAFDRQLIGDGYEEPSFTKKPPRRARAPDLRQFAYQESSSPSDLSSPLARPVIKNKPILKQVSRSTQNSYSRPEEKVVTRSPHAIALQHAPPIVHNIKLIPVCVLPDQLQNIFVFDNFNAVQSRCFHDAFQSDLNLVVSAPTASGKTTIFELAICRLLSMSSSSTYKVVYMAPTKALCSERRRDWENRFASSKIKCGELTGDTDQAQIGSVKGSDIIITTPEKWDSMTRRWHDHKKLMELVRLFLIDEVHMLKEARGAVLEAVVSRMKSIGTSVRFVALSATIPNPEDIAMWLSNNESRRVSPAKLQCFGEEFRPVKLERHVYGYAQKGNDFMFEVLLNHKLLDIVSKHAEGRPTVIFSGTRKGCSSAAKILTNAFSALNHAHLPWQPSLKQYTFKNAELALYVKNGVAFHHAGLDPSDRSLVESLFSQGEIPIVCCTSTLAVGVNLPARLVILKNTVGWAEGGAREYIDLEIMQMIGRAGRPQFDNKGVAVIMTAQEKKKRYENIVSGTEKIESSLHLNIVEHLNAEIGLGTITDVNSAIGWLKSTYFFVRISKNPAFYKLEGIIPGTNVEGSLEKLCNRDLGLLENASLIEFKDDRLTCTKIGHAMAKYYLKFQTMKMILATPPKAPLETIVCSQADEFRDFRIKSGEKSFYKSINKDDGMRLPLTVDIKETWHKIYILLQFELGSLENPNYDGAQKLLPSFAMEKNAIFQHVVRVAKCLVDAKVLSEDAISVKNALSFSRSLRAKCWEDSPQVLRQLDKVGPLAVKKLVARGIRSFESLRNVDAQLIELALSRNPPFGSTVLLDFTGIPVFKSQIELLTQKVCNNGVDLNLQLRVGIQNERTCREWHRDLLFASILTYTEEGGLLDFRRIPVYRLQDRGNYNVLTRLKYFTRFIECEVACDEIPGATCHVKFEVHLDRNNFPKVQEKQQRSARLLSLSYEDEELDSFLSSTLVNEPSNFGANDTRQHASTSTTFIPSKQLPNGNWECNHKCKDKNICKHLCCREGMDRPSRSRKPSLPSVEVVEENQTPKGQSTLNFVATPARPIEVEGSESSLSDKVNDIPFIDITGNIESSGKTNESNFLKRLNDLHTSSYSRPMELQKLPKTPQFLNLATSGGTVTMDSPSKNKAALTSEKSSEDHDTTPTSFRNVTFDVEDASNNTDLVSTPCNDSSFQFPTAKRKLNSENFSTDVPLAISIKMAKQSEKKSVSSKAELDINSLLEFLGPSVRLVEGMEQTTSHEGPNTKPLKPPKPKDKKDVLMLDNGFPSTLTNSWSLR